MSTIKGKACVIELGASFEKAKGLRGFFARLDSELSGTQAYIKFERLKRRRKERVFLSAFACFPFCLSKASGMSKWTEKIRPYIL